jgi:hypothetical protein
VPYLLGFLAVAVGIYIGVWLIVAGFMLYLLPALLIGAVVAVPAGAALAVVVAILTLTGLSAAPGVISPEDVVAASPRTSRGGVPKAFPRDRAWPSYFAGQATIDLAQVWRATSAVLTDGWRWIGRGVTGGWALAIPALVVASPLWICVSVGAYAAAGLILTAGVLIMLVLGVCWMAPTVLFRGLDRLIRKLRRASGSCPFCYHVTELPTFTCPGCGWRHRDVRPGRLGGLWRRCGCGTLLPTTVLRMAHKTQPQCPRCESLLRDGGAVVTDIRLPVFGPVSAGKTRLVYTGLLGLRDQVSAGGGVLDFVDEESQQTFEHAVALVGAGGDTVKTPADGLPHAITARVTLGRRRALLHMFDAAGEFYADRDDNSDLEFLDHAQGLVFVIDPFSIAWVRDQIGRSSGPDIVRMANPAHGDPEGIYHVTARRLRDYGVATRKRRLAVAVVKADPLDRLPLASPLDAGHVRQWLVDAGLDNLVLSAERDFGEVAYFVTASLAGTRATDARSPARPVAWLCAGAGLELWPGSGATADVPAQEEEESV